MDDLEQQLKRAMARKDAPAWFEAKVLAATQGTPRRIVQPRFRWVMAMAASLVLVGGIAFERDQAAKERAAGEAAKAKLELALRITGEKLQQIGQQMEAVQGN